ncbi:hypothetical protein AAIB41_07425 [Brucella sp. BE17]|uniref:hypothetical protein n=1 Tax=Brucella sp. BE17 TaxID=3142977 RepID=UPI0031BB1E80
MELAEAIYPGQLELYATYLQKAHYDVIFSVKGDPVTRIRLAMDRNPADCRLDAPCEKRLRMAYVSGIDLGAELKALDRTFTACGIPVLAVNWFGGKAHLVPIVQEPLNNENQNRVFDKLNQCVAQFRTDNYKTQWWNERSNIRIIIASNDTQQKPTKPIPLTFENSVPGFLQNRPAYSMVFRLDGENVENGALRFEPFHKFEQKIMETIKNEATGFLQKQADKPMLETSAILWDTQLDPQRVDMIRTYLLACTVEVRDGKRCLKGNVAIGIKYDINKHKVLEMRRIPIERDRSGSAIFPPLPSR